MSLLTLSDIMVCFSTHPLLDKASLAIEEKERICILGRNGVGKSTLLKLIAGEASPDSGDITGQDHVIVAKLTQDVPQDIQGSIYDVIAQGLGEQGQLIANYHTLLCEYESTQDDAVFQKLGEVQNALDAHNAWDLSHKVDSTISLLELDPAQEFADLSGGLKRRVLLGRALVTQPDILLLDEPTNHLDIASIHWLENFLKDFSGTVIFITHDRTFLQALASRIVEIDRGKISSYPGDYQNYLRRKEHELEVEETHNKNFDKKLAQEEAWIRQGIKARRTRNEGRVRALKKLREQRKARREQTGKANIKLQQAEKSGKKVIEAENIYFNYADKSLVNNFSTTIIRGDKIGLIGPNGVGKTTLLKLLLGQLQPEKGTITHGTKLEIAYFDQLRDHLDEEKTVADNVSYGDQYVKIQGKSIHIMTYLQDFLFTPERARSPAHVLSGGERNRLLLARLFTKPANVLVLDEPTNDLDLETLEILEELLVNYQGTLLLVSHDRQFLDNVVTSTIVFENSGEINEYVGGYEDWLRQRQHSTTASTPKTTPKEKPPVNEQRQQQKQLRSLEQKIQKLEEKQATIHKQLEDNNLYLSENAAKLAELQQQAATITEELTTLMAEWERLLG